MQQKNVSLFFIFLTFQSFCINMPEELQNRREAPRESRFIEALIKELSGENNQIEQAVKEEKDEITQRVYTERVNAYGHLTAEWICWFLDFFSSSDSIAKQRVQQVYAWQKHENEQIDIFKKVYNKNKNILKQKLRKFVIFLETHESEVRHEIKKVVDSHSPKDFPVPKEGINLNTMQMKNFEDCFVHFIEIILGEIWENNISFTQDDVKKIAENDVVVAREKQKLEQTITLYNHIPANHKLIEEVKKCRTREDIARLIPISENSDEHSEQLQEQKREEIIAQITDEILQCKACQQTHEKFKERENSNYEQLFVSDRDTQICMAYLVNKLEKFGKEYQNEEIVAQLKNDTLYSIGKIEKESEVTEV